MSDLIDGEIEVIEHFIKDTGIVFDVGACIGEWSNEVLKRGLAAHVYLFEPVSSSYKKVCDNLYSYIDKITVANYALSRDRNEFEFWKYESVPALSTRYKRNKALMDKLGVSEPVKENITSTSLDKYCIDHDIDRIDFLKIDTEGSELDVLKGAEELLKSQLIDYIQFEYGGCYLDAGITLEQVYDLLTGYDYVLFKISYIGMEAIKEFTSELEDYNYCNYLAIVGGIPKKDIYVWKQ